MTFSATDPNAPRPFRKGVDTPAVALTAPSDRPAHYRLSKATWEIILDAYRQGATVPELAAQWRVSEHALRKRITVHGATKRDWGDAEAMKQAEAWAASADARAEAEAARTAALFIDVGPDEAGDVDPADAAELARKATIASGRAMRKGMWNESRALASLAESYARLADRMGGTNISPDKLPLETLLGVLENRDGVITRRVNFDPLGPYDAETEMKKQHIRHKVQSYREAGYPEIVVEAIVRDMMDAGPPQPTPWPPDALK
jgi:hypothetical protein